MLMFGICCGDRFLLCVMLSQLLTSISVSTSSMRPGLYSRARYPRRMVRLVRAAGPVNRRFPAFMHWHWNYVTETKNCDKRHMQINDRINRFSVKKIDYGADCATWSRSPRAWFARRGRLPAVRPLARGHNAPA